MIKPIKSAREAVMVWLVSYLFFLFTLANNLSASHDSISYLLDIVEGRNLVHQHHLLYHYAAYFWLKIFHTILPSVSTHYIVESFTAVWGSASLALSYLFLRNRFTLPVNYSVIAISLIAFSYGTWFYSVNVEVYMPSVFLILCSLYIITRRELTSADPFKLAFFNSLAILFHQVNILFAVVVIYWLILNRRKMNSSVFFTRYAVTGTLITGATYLILGWLIEGHNSIDAFSRWVLGYTIGGDYWHGLTFKTPLAVITGFSRAFIGGHFIFQIPVTENFVSDSFQSHRLRDEFFLGRSISSQMAWTLTASAVLLATALITMAVRFAGQYKKMVIHYHVIKPLLACILVYSVFFCFWMPEILEFWILQMILTWLLLLGMLPAYRFPFRITLRWGLMFLAILLFAINYFGSMRWLQKASYDWYYTKVKELSPAIGTNDVVIVENEWILKDYVRYFTRAKVIATDEPGFSRSDVSRAVTEARGKNAKVYLFDGNSGSSKWVPIQSY